MRRTLFKTVVLCLVVARMADEQVVEHTSINNEHIKEQLTYPGRLSVSMGTYCVLGNFGLSRRLTQAVNQTVERGILPGWHGMICASYHIHVITHHPSTPRFVPKTPFSTSVYYLLSELHLSTALFHARRTPVLLWLYFGQRRSTLTSCKTFFHPPAEYDVLLRGGTVVC